MDALVAVTLTAGAWSPSSERIAASSAGSPSGGARGVGAHEVDASAAEAGLGQRPPGGAHGPGTTRRGERDVVRIRGGAIAADLG